MLRADSCTTSGHSNVREARLKLIIEYLVSQDLACYIFS